MSNHSNNSKHTHFVEGRLCSLMAPLVLLWSSFSVPFRLLKSVALPSTYLRRTFGVPSTKRLLRVALLAAMMAWMMPAMAQTAQTGLSGVYYIANFLNYSSTDHSACWYMVPAKDPQVANTCADAYYSPNCTTCNSEKPFMTTYQTNRLDNDTSVWILKEVDGESGFYYMIHAMTGKYLVYEPPFEGGNSGNGRRKSFHLQTQADLVLNDSAKFAITDVPNSVGAWDSNQRLIRIKKLTSGNRFLNPAGDQANYYHANSKGSSPYYYLGLVGVYSSYEGGTNNGDRNTRWYLEDTLMTAPTISDVSASNTITITDAVGLPAGYTIRYTTGDGSQAAPTATTGTEYSGPITVMDSWTVKAVVVRYGLVLTAVATKSVEPVVVAPTVTNNYDGTISLSTPTPNAEMYYTLDGTEPSNSNGTQYSSAFSLGNATVVKAVTLFGSVYSDVTTYNVPQYTEPTISFNSATSLVTIDPGSGGTAYYNTGDGSQADPTTSSTVYSAPFTVSSATTVKAIATHAGYLTSDVASLSITQVATPTIQNNGSNAISITTATDGATIYYTTDGSTPTTSSTEYTEPLTENVSGVTIKAIAVKENMFNSAVGSGTVTLQCAAPVITRNGNTSFIATCAFPATGVTIYYTTDGSTTPTTSTPTHINSGESVAIALPVTVKAIAVATNYNNSTVTTTTVTQGMGGSGTEADPYTIEYQSDVADFVSKANTASEASKYYKVIATTPLDFSGVAAITQPFSGNFDGNLQTLTGLQHALFNTVDGGVVKNVMLKGVAISSAADTVGAITNIATGYSRIYNCGILPNNANFPEGTHPSVATSGNCAGGLVGSLRDDSRVVNCFSYADVQASNLAAGIVGRNTFASDASETDGKYANLRTMVVNCMFYGNITGGTNQYGVYGGQLITNAATTGINSYNYYSNGSTFSTTSTYGTGEPTAYNCSFPAEERYLTQVEFHRSLLNSNRELCGWWVRSDVAPSTLTTADVQAIPKDASLMAKWVLDPNIAPYPILKPFGKYPSVINPFTGTPWFDHTQANLYEGKQLGTLTVTVKSGTHSSAADQTLYLPITDMDTLHYDFGYRKVQLPYYNTVFGNPNVELVGEPGSEGYTALYKSRYADNYTDSVVTGWKVTVVDGGELGTFVGGVNKTQTGYLYDEYAWQNGYNFTDRKCTAKDIYNISGRVFAQGGNYYVPDGVTGITIEAYWGKAIYVRNADASYDRVNITTSDGAVNTGSDFAPAGTRGNNVNGATIQSTSKLSDALNNTTIPTKATVYDYALVLVGNVQESVGKKDFKHPNDNTRGFTIMSVDLDFDEEPDYCLEWQLGYNMGRQEIAPIRFDFLPIIELGIAGKLDGSNYFLSLGCYRSRGHFEVTETAFIRFGQFEFELGTRDDGPIILNGGIYDQYCRGRNGETNQHINYVIVGGHIIMPSFTPGAHVGASYQTRHCAVNALGGDFTSFYLTGGYREDVIPYEDNPHCYIDGGHFGTIAAAYKEGISGDVTWRINHALIGEFYGGGVMAEATGDYYKIVKGNIDVVIDNSIVRKYCGGPKFGDMVEGKTVTTSATKTVFTQYFGAGNGGTNYTQYKSTDNTGAPISNWSGTINTWYHIGQYRNTEQGYEANYDIEVINTSTGNQGNYVVNRSYYYAAQFATTNTGTVTNTLTDCTVKTNFYGAGFLGGVTGSVTSVLTDTDVYGSAYGAGYSASAGTVTIYNKDKIPPKPNVYTGMIKPQSGGTPNTYYWSHNHGSTGSPATAASPATHDTAYFYTEISLENLGAVSNNVTLVITGNSTIGTVEGGNLVENTGNVFGGGDQSAVTGNTTVYLQDNTQVLGNVYGGGNNGSVNGDSEVVIQDIPVISGTTPFTESTTVTIAGPAGASLYYTIDGSTPTASSTAYTGSISLDNTTTVKAIAITNGVSSPVVTKTFTKQP